MNLIKLWVVVLTAALLCACGGETGTVGPGGGAGDVGGAGAGPSSGGSGAGGEVLPPDPIAVGFGADGAPCAYPEGFTPIGPASSETGDLGSRPILVPVAGTVTGVSVVIAVGFGPCSEVARTVRLSKSSAVMSGEGAELHEEVSFSEPLVEEAPDYPVEGVPEYSAVRLHRDLAVPLHVEEGSYIHLASVLATTDTCIAGCRDTNAAPIADMGSQWCTGGPAWEGCGLMTGPAPGVGHVNEFLAWVEFQPDGAP